MSRDYRLYLRDMLEAIRFIETQGSNLTWETLTDDDVLLRAILHSLIVIGEVANHIPQQMQEQAPDVPWTDIVGIRNIIVHGYFALNLPIIWDVIHNEVPILRHHIEALLQNLENET